MAFPTKTPKSEEQEKTEYTVYYPHNIRRQDRAWQGWGSDGSTPPGQPTVRRAVGIDPAINNFAMRIEDWYSDGRIIPVYYNYVSFDYLEADGTSTLTNQVEDYLARFHHLFLHAHFIFVERQLPTNYRAVTISKYVLYYFASSLRNKGYYPDIVEVSAKIKGKYLGKPTYINKAGLKRWSAAKAKQQLRARGDTWSLDMINNAHKSDDLGDVVTMIIAMFILWELVPAAPFVAHQPEGFAGPVQEPLGNMPSPCLEANQGEGRLVQASARPGALYPDWQTHLPTPLVVAADTWGGINAPVVPSTKSRANKTNKTTRASVPGSERTANPCISPSPHNSSAARPPEMWTLLPGRVHTSSNHQTALPLSPVSSSSNHSSTGRRPNISGAVTPQPGPVVQVPPRFLLAQPTLPAPTNHENIATFHSSQVTRATIGEGESTFLHPSRAMVIPLGWGFASGSATTPNSTASTYAGPEPDTLAGHNQHNGAEGILLSSQRSTWTEFNPCGSYAVGTNLPPSGEPISRFRWVDHP